MFLQGSDLLHACNGTRSTLRAVLSIVILSREREEREEESFVEGGLRSD